MSEYRQLHKRFWESSSVEELEPEEKLVYVYLITGPRSNMEGLYKLTVTRVSFDTGLDTQRIRAILRLLEERQLGGHRDGWCCVPKASEFMPGNRWMMQHAHDTYEEAGDAIMAWAFSLGMEYPRGYEEWLKDEPKLQQSRKARGIGRAKATRVFERDGNRCTNCGSTEGLVIHHVLAVRDGGTHDEDNLVVLCSKCHTKAHKGDYARWHKEWVESLEKDTTSFEKDTPLHNTILNETKQNETTFPEMPWKRDAAQ